MRFTDKTLIEILRKMRTPGGVKLSAAEWKALQATNVDGDVSRLIDTQEYYQAAYTWSIVSMAQSIRSVLSARVARATLFVVQACDECNNLPDFCCPAMDDDSDTQEWQSNEYVHNQSCK